MAYTPQANPAAVTALIGEGNFLTQDAKFDLYVESTNKNNPFYGTFITTAETGLGDVNHVASNTLHDFYTENNDPRLMAAFRPSPTNGSYNSIPQGTGNSFNNQARDYARPNVGATTPVFFLTVFESEFLQAEALIRYSGGSGAKQHYDAGVAASFALYSTYFGLTGANPTDFTGAGGVYEFQMGGTVEQMVRQVMIQKWAALPYVNNIEAYVEATRTKFPEVVDEGTQDYGDGNRIPSAISVLPGTTIPSILFYPEAELSRNPNITQHSSLTENVWWDQKPE